MREWWLREASFEFSGRLVCAYAPAVGVAFYTSGCNDPLCLCSWITAAAARFSMALQDQTAV